MVEIADADLIDSRQPDLYWKELFQLKVQCEYVRRYNSVLTKWVTRIAGIRAIASSSSIAGWALWKDYAFLWGGIIVISQITDALQNVIPFTARQKATNALHLDLEALFIEVLYEWEGIYSGKFTNEEITERRRKLMLLKHDLDKKHFPTSDLPERSDLLILAEQDAIDYLEGIYTEGNAP